MNGRILLAAVIVSLALPLDEMQASQDLPKVELSLGAFLREVENSNLDYAAERYSVSIAQAQLAAARVYLPNPQVQLGYSSDITRGRARSERESAVSSAGITQTFELGGKRGDRIEIARHTLLAASATLEDFWLNLRSSATDAFIDAQTKQLVAIRMQQSSNSFSQVAVLNAQRLKAGDVGEVDAIQARVDALQFRTQYLSAKNDAENAVISLSQLAGPDWAAKTIVPRLDLELPAKDYSLSDLIALAMDKRPDVVNARESLDAAAAAVRLARANRIPDVGIGLTYSQTGASNNTIAPYEKTDTLGAALSFELPVFTRYLHELEVARDLYKQADKQLALAQLNAQIEVRQAYATYLNAVEQIAQYKDQGAIRDAEAVLKAKTFSYEHGASSLLDLLQAQRDLNDVYIAYYGALSASAEARINLEQKAGIWNFEFQ